MPTLLMVLGFGWAIIGLLNLVGMFGAIEADQTGIATFGLMFNVILFILPGAGLGGLGWYMGQRRKGESDRVNAAVKAALEAERKTTPDHSA